MERVMLDMDGVIADFVGGVCKRFDIVDPFRNPANHGLWDILPMDPRLAKLAPGEFWNSLDYTFWYNLPVTEDASAIIETLLTKYSQEQICILSSPCYTKGCMDGKLQWLRKHFPKFAKQFLFGNSKQFCAAPTNLLVDDRCKNVDDFESFGGNAILYPRLWNRLYSKTQQALDHLKEQLKHV